MSKYSIAHELGSKPRTSDVLLPEGEDLEFSSMLLPQFILRGLCRAGFVKPSPIQLKAIPLARCGFDLIVQAKSGTGKTCVFAVAALESLMLESNRLQVIVLAPTREIAQQIQHVISTIGSQLKNLKTKTFIGGVPLSEDKLNIVNCQIAVGAPGRIRHLIEEQLLCTDAVRLLVLDEADKLMEEIFQNDISYIFQQLPESKQVVACSATYTQELLYFLGNYMQSATHVTPGQDPSPILIGLRHFVCIEPASFNNLSKLKHKENCLLKILKNVSFLQCMVFSNHHNRAESVCNQLKKHGWKASWIAGKQNQMTRSSVMTDVKDFKVRILVTTDLTARGIDVHDVNLVINLDIPQDHHTYLHRMGRAGRYGGHGLVISIITEDEINKFKRLLRNIGDSYAAAYIIPENKPSDKLWKDNIINYEQLIGSLNCYSTDDDNGEEGGDDDDDKISIISVSETNIIEINDDINIINKNDKGIIDDKNNIKVLVDNNYLNNDDFVNNTSNIDPNMIKVINNTDINDELIIKKEKDIEMSGNDNINKVNSKLSLSLTDDSSSNSDAEKYSDSDSDSDDDDDDEQIVDEVKDENHSDIDSTNDNLMIKSFGLKLLKCNSGCSNPDTLQSYFVLDSSLNNFIDNKCNTDYNNDNNNLNKKLLEPKGTIDTEVIENFSRKLMNDYNNLIYVCQNIKTDAIINTLLNDTTTTIFNEGFSQLKNSNDNNDEYDHQNNDCESSGDDDDDVNSNNYDENDFIINNDIKLTVSELNNSFDKLNVNNIEMNDFVNNKEINSEIENSDEDKRSYVDYCDSKLSNNINNDIDMEDNNCDVKLNENISLFTRKKNKRKRKNIYSSSNTIKNNITDYENKTVDKLYQNKNFKKVKHYVKSDSDFNESSVSGVNNYSNSNIKMNEQNMQHNFYADSHRHNLSNFRHERSCPYAAVHRNNYYGNHSGNIYSNNNMSNMPKELQKWYNMWYNQASYIQWYVGYNKYVKSMLNRNN